MIVQVSSEPCNLDNLASDFVGLLVGTSSLRLERRQTGFELVAFAVAYRPATESVGLVVATSEPFFAVA